MFLKCWILFSAAVLLSAGRITRPKQRIVGGHQVSIAEVPWQAAILSHRDHICGGAVYSDRIILTAAHCLHDRRAEDLSIRAGSSRWRSGGQETGVAKIISHDKYKLERGADPYDIAVLVLETPLELGGNIQTIPLAEQTPQAGTEALVTGWGREMYAFSRAARYLRGVNVFIEDHLKCTRALAYENKVVTEDNLCAAAPGRDACHGDSGGPLVDVNSGQLIGLVSWGFGCADPRYPGIYADVAFFKDWIRQAVFNSSLSRSEHRPKRKIIRSKILKYL